MGVHGLWRLLESTGKPINPETLEGKILAPPSDISIWLNQAVKGVRDREGNSVQNAHLLTLFNRVCKLLFFRIRPVFVFDGDAPMLKKRTLALRRQRKEELTSQSKQTNEKLLKTFLKRQAIKAAIGHHSKDPLPSLSNVRRNEVDDIYVLPALPPAEEKERSSSEEDEEGEEREEIVDSFQTYQEELYEDPNSVDINSENFASLPPEMKHEILKEMKDFCKRRRTMFNKPPERSGDFSQYQLSGLLQRNRLNQRLEGVEKEMSQRSAGSAPHLGQQDGDQQYRSVESNRLVSEDHSHYILIKGSKKNEATSESQPGSAPWSGSSQSTCRKRKTDKPEPLWRPITEEEQEEAKEEVPATCSEASNPSVSKPSRQDTSPPSPRTLKAIQAAMSDSSDEEKVDLDTKYGKVSPRTLLAIQQALTEEEGEASGSPFKLQTNLQRPVGRVVISSSEEETQPSPEKKSDFSQNATHQSGLHIEDSLLGSSSEDELEEVIGQRNRAFRSAGLQQSPKTGMESEEGSVRDAEIQKELEARESEPKPHVSASNQELFISLPSLPCGRPPSTETEAGLLDKRRDTLTESLGETNGDDVKTENSEGSDSEESFIEVSEEEFKQGDAGDPAGGKKILEEVQKDESKKEEESEERWTEVPDNPALVSDKEEEKTGSKNQEEEVKDGMDTKSKPTAANNEWEQLDMDELEALESSLQLEQSNLREQKQQQERMANTVTGQMYLESQELLRLFGVPFLVAPMEAEAQCAALDRTDQTHGTITDDSDVWLFGGRHVYKNFFSQSKYVEHYQYSDLHSQLGLDRTKMINLAYLLGSDYTEGVPGVGYVTGMEILNEFPGPGLEPLTQLSNWWSEAQEKKRLTDDPRDTKVKKKLRELKLQPGFPNPAVAQAYLQPAVDQSETSFSWGRPQLDMIKEFCLSRFGWSTRKTEETLQPVIKQINTQQTQLRIDSFFRLEQQEKQAIRSQRLRRAVTCLKRKERDAGESESSEDETPSPSKSRKVNLKNTDEQKEDERPGTGGGFLVSESDADSTVTSLRDVCRTGQGSFTATIGHQSTEKLPQKVRRNSSSSSSGEDSDEGRDVEMVTARSVFEGNRRGRGGKRSRGRGKKL
ncbi:DNA excision repair protein ERCC-5 isoform X1 [Girardinichthys multiradiatus]|uniref:DNA excision repair protein ERCC-5 isoform X1 n=1 Tax=Girardinichthys multiradiatus TaxID=208333 RepID=UPI001FAB68C9|nr:DNA excision repair protein ERCC-5 isoform X1 [Girardinichthys multiradiatus]